MSQIKVRPMKGGDIETYLDTRYEISEMYKSKTPIFVYNPGKAVFITVMI